MVDALRRLHRWLRPDGILLDIHPEPVSGGVEVWQRDEVHVLGHVEQEDDIGEILAARARLDRLESEGWFVAENRRFFELLSHFPSVEDWFDFQEKEGYSGALTDEVLRAARRLLSDGHGEFVIREPSRASRLRRQAAPGGSAP